MEIELVILGRKVKAQVITGWNVVIPNFPELRKAILAKDVEERGKEAAMADSEYTYNGLISLFDEQIAEQGDKTLDSNGYPVESTEEIVE